MKEVASLRFGVIFKKAFSDIDVFNGFVRDILGIPFHCDIVETEKEFKPTLGHVKVKFDCYAEDLKNRVIVEIQHERNADHYDRFLHYHCVALLEPHLTAITVCAEAYRYNFLIDCNAYRKDVLALNPLLDELIEFANSV